MLKKKMISVLLVLAMVLGMSVPAMAAEEKEETVGKATETSYEEILIGAKENTASCTHSNKKFHTSGVIYESCMSMGHFKISYVKYQCIDCKKILDPEYTNRSLEEHTLERDSFTGNHYHRGTTAFHMAEYKYICSYCDYYTTQWDSYACPGGQNGGVCITPIFR